MDIQIVTGIGTGRTLLSAFDCALNKAGVCNYNLITLSSIIPPRSKVIKINKYQSPPADFGRRLYVIKAETRSQETGKFITAGMGWYQLNDGRGFFVEHELKGETREAVKSEIEARIVNSLGDLCRFRRIPFKKAGIKSAIATTQVKDAPTCVLVLAVYQSEKWRDSL